MLKDGFNDRDSIYLCMLDWGETSTEEKKRFIIASAIAATIITIGSIAARYYYHRLTYLCHHFLVLVYTDWLVDVHT
jgi:hypothetical protein